MGFPRRLNANRLIDQALGRDAHTKKGHSLHGDFIEGTNTPPLRVVKGVIVGMCALGTSIAILFLPPEKPNPHLPAPSTITSTSPHPTIELQPSEDGPTAQNKLIYDQSPPHNPNTTTTFILEPVP